VKDHAPDRTSSRGEHFVANAEPLEHGEALWSYELAAEFLSWKPALLEQENTAPALSQQRRGGGTRRPASYDDDVEGCPHCVFMVAGGRLFRQLIDESPRYRHADSDVIRLRSDRHLIEELTENGQLLILPEEGLCKNHKALEARFQLAGVAG
jgi:hypothetical protein